MVHPPQGYRSRKRGLRYAVRSVLETARRSKKRAIKRDVQVDTEDDELLLVDVVADPLIEDETLLVFQDASAIRRSADDDKDVEAEGYTDEDRIGQLEDELDETRVKLRTTVEELETSNEEQLQRRNDVDERRVAIDQ